MGTIHLRRPVVARIYLPYGTSEYTVAVFPNHGLDTLLLCGHCRGGQNCCGPHCRRCLKWYTPATIRSRWRLCIRRPILGNPRNGHGRRSLRFALAHRPRCSKQRNSRGFRSMDPTSQHRCASEIGTKVICDSGAYQKIVSSTYRLMLVEIRKITEDEALTLIAREESLLWDQKSARSNGSVVGEDCRGVCKR